MLNYGNSSPHVAGPDISAVDSCVKPRMQTGLRLAGACLGLGGVAGILMLLQALSHTEGPDVSA